MEAFKLLNDFCPIFIVVAHVCINSYKTNHLNADTIFNGQADLLSAKTV